MVLALDPDGTPGVVYGIGEDLALQLAAPDLGAYLERFTAALDATLTALAERGPADADSKDARTDAAEQLIDQHLFAELLGMTEIDAATEVPLQEPRLLRPVGPPRRHSRRRGPARSNRRRSRGPDGSVDVPGDPLETHVAWSARGRVIALLGG